MEVITPHLSFIIQKYNHDDFCDIFTDHNENNKFELILIKNTNLETYLKTLQLFPSHLAIF